ncbi:MAG: RdgB/HAM1 family non-canonical purine NTP pyrophosphatase [Hyphomicrobiales bacterium]|nr:RdgB/HAM1 family non-canonical purine NTP pyrophosphatase [Hyphomicrobiales bacterium]
MARPLTSGTLVVASHNPGKVREIGDLLSGTALTIVSAGALSLPEPEESGATFVENALIKAHSAADGSKQPALADDSGLVVPALNGAPGIHSARWGGPAKDFSVAMERVENALTGHSDRRAHFVCVLALAWPDGHTEVFEGFVHGTLTWPPRGDKGFGYDPMFIPDGHAITFGEMNADDKHRISHRADAFHQLLAACLIP